MKTTLITQIAGFAQRRSFYGSVVAVTFEACLFREFNLSWHEGQGEVVSIF